MDTPAPPEEPEVKNIIDKLANFVARNGMEFENMTKEKQKGNPKFAFLFGGQHYSYYQYRLHTEQQMQSQQKAISAQVSAQEAMVQQSLQNAPWQQPPQQSPMPPMMPPFPMPQMGMRMPIPPPNMPPWQQMGQQPPMGMPPFPPPTSSTNLPFPPGPPQRFQNQQPVSSHDGQNMNMGQPQTQQASSQQNFPGMYQQPPPSMQQAQQHMSQPPQQQQQGVSSANLQEVPITNDQKPPSQFEKEEQGLAKAEEDAKTKIEESSSNLSQQYQVLMQQQQEKIEEAVSLAQEEKLKKLASGTGIILKDFDSVLQPIINTCTKDSISAGKSWILTNSKTMEHCEAIGQHLLKRIMDAEKLPANEVSGGKSKFDTQLHLVYLINDVLHHASRKHLTDLSNALQSVILPIFCMANANAPEERKERLSKLLGLWNKFKYFNPEILEKIKDPPAALSEYQANLITEHAEVVKLVQAEIQNQYSQYQKQHEEYAAHIRKQVENQKAALDNRRTEAKKAQEEKEREEAEAKEQGYDEGEEDGYNNYEKNVPWNRNFEPSIPMQFDYGHGNNQHPQVVDYSHQRGPGDWPEDRPPPPWGPRGPRGPAPWQDAGPPPWGPRGPRPRGPPPGMVRGPPPPMDPDDPSLIPTVPYYDLPAGLMCPLVKLEDMDYKPLDPSLIRLPPPIPPSERLLAAVEAFYGPPSHERPRNVDGWERNGLFEFYRAKVRAKRRKDGGDVSRSRSRSKSKSKSRSRSGSRHRSKSRSRSRSRSGGRRSYSRSSSSRSRSRSRSGSRSRSHSSRSRSRSRSRSPRQGDGHRRSRSRSEERSPRRRSRERTPTPPLLGPNFFQPTPEGKLGDENRGAQMLKRMGWGGAGLGAAEQGMEDPIQAGEVRDKYDQFKGLGMPANDPYESFRKSKSQGFLTRIRSRDEERKLKRAAMNPSRRNRNEDD